MSCEPHGVVPAVFPRAGVGSKWASSRALCSRPLHPWSLSMRAGTKPVQPASQDADGRLSEALMRHPCPDVRIRVTAEGAQSLPS
jgi:hypothetical protein